MTVTKLRAPKWKIATLYEGSMRGKCVVFGHTRRPCIECRIFFLHNTKKYSATYAEIVRARDELKRKK